MYRNAVHAVPAAQACADTGEFLKCRGGCSAASSSSERSRAQDDWINGRTDASERSNVHKKRTDGLKEREILDVNQGLDSSVS